MNKERADAFERRNTRRVLPWVIATLITWPLTHIVDSSILELVFTFCAISLVFNVGWARGRRRGHIDACDRWYASVGRELQRAHSWSAANIRLGIQKQMPRRMDGDAYIDAIRRCVPPEWNPNQVGAHAAIRWGRAYDIDHETHEVRPLSGWPLEPLE